MIMKRKLAILALLLFLVAILIATVRARKPTTVSTARTVLVTNYGKLSLLPNDANFYATMKLTVDRSKAQTSTSNIITNAPVH